MQRMSLLLLYKGNILRRFCSEFSKWSKARQRVNPWRNLGMKLEKYLSKLANIHYKWEAINMAPVTQILVVGTLRKDDLSHNSG